MDSSTQTLLVVAFTIAAAAWLGAVAAAVIFGVRVRATGTPDQGVAYARTFARVTRRVALPAALIALVSGIGWVAATDSTIEQHWWIGTALGAWIVAFVGSTMLRAPQLSRAVHVAGELGSADEDVQWRIRQVTLIARGELLLLSVAAIVLVIRPS